MTWLDRAVSGLTGGGADEARNALSFDEYQSWFQYSGLNYPFMSRGTLSGPIEEIPGDFDGVVAQAYKGNGIVFSCLNARLRLFSEARFQFRRMQSGRPGELFGTQALAPLEVPWTNATTSDLLKRMEQDASIAGNFYAHRPGRVQSAGPGMPPLSPRLRRSGDPVIRRLRPDWVSIVLGSQLEPEEDPSHAIDAEVIGYFYQPGGARSNRDPIFIPPDEIAHFAPIPDPTAHFRGMSWLTPIIRDVMADGAATAHKLKFFENGATANMVVTGNEAVKNQEQFDRWVAKMNLSLSGLRNAYKTLYLAHGSDAKVVGADLKQIDFKVVQGGGETRVASAAGIPPIIVGLSEGLAAGTYNNYGQARRAFADLWARPTWRDAAGSLATLIDVPPPTATDTTELWYDDRDIPFLAEDVKDAAVSQQITASTIASLLDAGFQPDDVVAAVMAGDLKRLKGKHTGLFSVQLQAPGSVVTPKDPKPVAAPQAASNGRSSNDDEAGRALRALLDD